MGRAPPGLAGQGGVSWRAADGPHTQPGPGHPVLGGGPNQLCLQNLSALFPPPPPTTSPRVQGAGRWQAGPEGA